MPKILIILICSLILAFFAAFIACYFLAKLTSLPGKKSEAEEDEFNLYGIKYNCVARNIEVKTKSYSSNEHVEKQKRMDLEYKRNNQFGGRRGSAR